MKRIIAVLLCIVFVAALAACGEDHGYAHYNYDLSEYITVGGYKDLDVTVYTKTRDREKQEVIDYYTAYYATLDKTIPAKDGDTVSITFTCTVDGTKVDAESATSTYVTLGNTKLLPEVEAAIIGMKGEETVTVEATFPADYESEAEVAGKAATFELTLNHVMVDAVYDDAFVATYFTSYGVSTMAEFEEYMDRNYVLNAVIDAIFESESFKLIAYPEKELNALVEEQIAYEDSMYQSYYGYSLEEVLELDKKTLADYKKELAEDESLLATVKTEMLYHYIIRTEGLEASEDEAAALQTKLINENLTYYQQMYAQYGITGETLNTYLANVLASLKETYTIEECKLNIQYELVEELLVSGQSLTYVDDFDPAEAEESTESGEN